MSHFGDSDRFFTIDVETANPVLHSICQIGVAGFEHGRLTSTWSTLVNPEDYFAPINTAIHGISVAMVADAPKLPEVAQILNQIVAGSILASHTSFDRVSIGLAYARYGLTSPDVRWLDSARVVRRTWSDLAKKGYGLGNTAKMLGIEFKHHDALEDAKATGEVLLAAFSESGRSLGNWIEKLQERPERTPITAEVNPVGEWFGEVIVFTGELEIPRRQAAAMAANAGCRVDAGVTKETTLLVVGDQDLSQLNGHQKSAKHRKAESLIEKGQLIRILRESDFQEIANAAGSFK